MKDTERQFLPLASHPRFWLLLALCLTLLMPNNDSIWIDEAQTAGYAMQPTLGAWMDRLQHDHFSEAQMPLGMATAWAAGKVIGTREWQLRAINLLWTGAAIVFVWLIGCQFRAPALALVAAIHPFVWLYTNEARPYAMQIAGGACLMLAAWKCCVEHREGRSWIFLWAIAAFVLSASSMLGVIPVAVVSAWMALSSFRTGPRLDRRSIATVCVTVALLGLLGLYYLGSLQRGAGGAVLWPVGFGNLAFSAYELLGFAGLGPTRQSLRDAFSTGQIAATVRPYVLLLACSAVATAAMLWRAINWYRQGARSSLGLFLFAVPLLCAAILFALAKAVHFPFWGRHLAPLVPFIVAGLGFPALLSRGMLPRIFCVIWLSASLISALELRFARRHKKDDNRSAAAVTKAALLQGETVWWSADRRSAEYYGINFGDPSDGREVIFLPGLSADRFRALAEPDLVVVSKPQTFDPDGAVREFLSRHNYKQRDLFQAIAVWVKP